MGKSYGGYRPGSSCCCPPPRPSGCCPEGGYILEKIVQNDREELCYTGLLEICGLPHHLCPPLCLRSAEVMNIEPCMPDACTPCGEQRFRLALLCCVVDSRGCRAEGMAHIEVLLHRGIRPPCGMNVRRGVQVQVRSACFCPPCSFDVCLGLCINTIVSRCEIVGKQPACPPSCPPLPLYPPPIPAQKSCYCGQFGRS